MGAVSILMLSGTLTFLALILLDRLMAYALDWLGPMLPDDACGPDGWLRDTRDQTGVFDRRRGR